MTRSLIAHLPNTDKTCSDKSSNHSSDKEAKRSLHMCHMSPPLQPSSTERAGKECRLDDTTQTSSTDAHTCPQSPSKCMSKTKDQSSFTTPSSTSTPNKIGSGLLYHSNSTDSRCSMTPLDTSLYGSFSYHGSSGVGHGSITPITSVAGSQRVTSSMWQLPRPFSPALPPATDSFLSAEQAVEINQLATECQALGAELAKQFQNLSGLEAMHCTMAQATAHETINVGCMAHNAAFSTIAANQLDRDCKKFLHQFHAVADQAWKDTNDVIFSHQLRYDAQLVAEGTLQAKGDKIQSHIHSIAEAVGLPNKACLTLALQILDKLPTLPWTSPTAQPSPGCWPIAWSPMPSKPGVPLGMAITFWTTMPRPPAC